jgi:L-fucose isomerase-like protein
MEAEEISSEVERDLERNKRVTKAGAKEKNKIYGSFGTHKSSQASI